MDIVIGIVLIIGLYSGIKNGLFVEIASIISFILGVFLAIKFSYLAKGFWKVLLVGILKRFKLLLLY
nr:CvpA family protein [Flavobacterium piscinae]